MYILVQESFDTRGNLVKIEPSKEFAPLYIPGVNKIPQKSRIEHKILGARIVTRSNMVKTGRQRNLRHSIYQGYKNTPKI